MNFVNLTSNLMEIANSFILESKKKDKEKSKNTKAGFGNVFADPSPNPSTGKSIAPKNKKEKIEYRYAKVGKKSVRVRGIVNKDGSITTISDGSSDGVKWNANQKYELSRNGSSKEDEISDKKNISNNQNAKKGKNLIQDNPKGKSKVTNGKENIKEPSSDAEISPSKKSNTKSTRKVSKIKDNPKTSNEVPEVVQADKKDITVNKETEKNEKREKDLESLKDNLSTPKFAKALGTQYSLDVNRSSSGAITLNVRIQDRSTKTRSEKAQIVADYIKKVMRKEFGITDGSSIYKPGSTSFKIPKTGITIHINSGTPSTNAGSYLGSKDPKTNGAIRNIPVRIENGQVVRENCYYFENPDYMQKHLVDTVTGNSALTPSQKKVLLKLLNAKSIDEIKKIISENNDDINSVWAGFGEVFPQYMVLRYKQNKENGNEEEAEKIAEYMQFPDYMLDTKYVFTPTNSSNGVFDFVAVRNDGVDVNLITNEETLENFKKNWIPVSIKFGPGHPLDLSGIIENNYSKWLDSLPEEVRDSHIEKVKDTVIYKFFKFIEEYNKREDKGSKTLRYNTFGCCSSVTGDPDEPIISEETIRQIDDALKGSNPKELDKKLVNRVKKDMIKKVNFVLKNNPTKKKEILDKINNPCFPKSITQVSMDLISFQLDQNPDDITDDSWKLNQDLVKTMLGCQPYVQLRMGVNKSGLKNQYTEVNEYYKFVLHQKYTDSVCDYGQTRGRLGISISSLK